MLNILITKTIFETKNVRRTLVTESETDDSLKKKSDANHDWQKWLFSNSKKMLILTFILFSRENQFGRCNKDQESKIIYYLFISKRLDIKSSHYYDCFFSFNFRVARTIIWSFLLIAFIITFIVFQVIFFSRLIFFLMKVSIFISSSDVFVVAFSMFISTKTEWSSFEIIVWKSSSFPVSTWDICEMNENCWARIATNPMKKSDVKEIIGKIFKKETCVGAKPKKTKRSKMNIVSLTKLFRKSLKVVVNERVDRLIKFKFVISSKVK